MLKVVVFDSGYGGELFADRLEQDLPIVEVIRVIDWRHADQIQSSPRKAREFAEIALRPYIGKVDLIIFANCLLSVTSLRHFERRYGKQKFIGLGLKIPDSPIKRNTLVLATKPITKTFAYHAFLFRAKRKTKTLTLDDWPAKIDDGELSEPEIHQTLKCFSAKSHLRPGEIVLACTHFNDFKPILRDVFGRNLKVYDSFGDAVNKVCKTLKIRGGTGRKAKI